MKQYNAIFFSADFEIRRNIPCVYQITNHRNGRIYIGSCVSITKRLAVHNSKLRKGKASPYLQKEYNKHGDAYLMKAIEYCSIENMIEREQFWLNKYYDDQQNCYNINPTAYSQLGTKFSDEVKAKMSQNAKKITVELVSPTGEVVTVVGIKKFCKEINISQSNLSCLRKGKTNTCKGWRLASKKDEPLLSRHEQTAEKLKRTFDIRLVNRSNEIFGPIVNMNQFCKVHNISSEMIRQLLKGKVKIAKGWRLEANKHLTEEDVEQERIQKISKIYDVQIQSPTGEIYGPIINLSRFCREHNIRWAGMHAFIIGEKESYKEWKKITK